MVNAEQQHCLQTPPSNGRASLLVEQRMRRSRHAAEHSPLTFGQALKASVRIMTGCEQCRRSFEPDNAGLVERYGATTTVINWAKRLRCSRCGGHATFVISGAPR